jgi:hypothetical protein
MADYGLSWGTKNISFWGVVAQINRVSATSIDIFSAPLIARSEVPKDCDQLGRRPPNQ